MLASMFAGSPPEALAFHGGLEQDDAKSYREAHRAVHETAVRDPMEALVEEPRGEFGRAWHSAPDALLRIRAAIDADDRGEALKEIAARLEDEGMPLHAPEPKTAPRGFARDHTRIVRLRRERFAAMALLEPGRWLHTRTALDRVAAQWRVGRPLDDWLERAVA